MFTVNKNPTNEDLRKFGYAMLVGFFAVGAVLWFAPLVKSWDVLTLNWSGTPFQLTAVGLQALGVGLCVLSLTSPTMAKPVYVVWMTITTAIGAVMSTVMLTVLFFLLLPIFSVVVRFGDPLRRRRRKCATYWEDCKSHDKTLERMQRPF